VAGAGDGVTRATVVRRSILVALVAATALVGFGARAQSTTASVGCVPSTLISIYTGTTTIAGDVRTWWTFQASTTSPSWNQFPPLPTGQMNLLVRGSTSLIPFVAPGTLCGNSPSFVLMNYSDYSWMVDQMGNVKEATFSAAVTAMTAQVSGFQEAVTVGLMVLGIIAGFAIGWMMFGPKRKSVIEIGA
jgi:hypothetical protein